MTRSRKCDSKTFLNGYEEFFFSIQLKTFLSDKLEPVIKFIDKTYIRMFIHENRNLGAKCKKVIVMS